MKIVSGAALKRALNTVGVEQRNQSASSGPTRIQQAELRKNRQATENMVSAALQKAGLDLREYKALQDKRSTLMNRVVADQRAQALRRAAHRHTAFRASWAAQANALRSLAAGNGFFPHPSFSLDTPLLIWGIPNTPIYDDAAVPFGSWAKFKFSASSSQGEQKQRVGFYFLWTNPYNGTALIDAATSFSADGFIKANAPWSLGSNYSQIWALALFNIWLSWPTSEVSSSSDFSQLGTASAFSSFLLGGDTNGTPISAGLSLSPTTPMAVPPGGVVFFEVAMDLHYEIDGGDIEADFQSGNFQIACPVVVLWLLNTPGFIFPYPVSTGGEVNR